MNSTKFGILVTILWFGLFPDFQSFGQKGNKNPGKRSLQDAQNVFIDATKAEILEENREALTLYQRSLELDPTNAAAHFKISDLLCKENQFSEALSHAKRANELDPKNLFYALQLAHIQETTSDWKGAIKTYNRIVDKFEETDYYMYSIAQLYLKNKKLKDAIQQLDKAEKAMGPSKESFQLKQRIFLDQNNYAKAIEEGLKWRMAFPEDPEPYFALPQLMMSNGKFDEAKEELKLLLERFPNFPAAHLMLADIYINKQDEANADREMELAFSSPDLPISNKIDLVAAYLRGMNSEEEAQKANRLTDLILQTHPEDPRGFIIKGDILNKQNRRKEARDLYLKGIAREKNNFGLWEQIVLIDLNLNELDSVIKHTSEAKTLFPNTPSFSFYNGLANLMTKKYEDAIEPLEHAKRISLDNTEMQLEVNAQLGDAYHNLKDHEKSGKAFDEVLKLDSANAHVLNNYSYFLSLEKTNLDKALKMSTKLISLFPDDPTYLDTHGWVLYVRKEYKSALAPLEKAAKSSKSGVIWEHYGDVLFRLGRINEAMDAWKTASELGGEISEQLNKKLKDKKIYE